MGHVAICFDSPPPEVLEALRGALEDQEGVQVEQGGIRVEGSCSPDRINALMGRALEVAGHLRLSVRCVEDPERLSGDPCGE